LYDTSNILNTLTPNQSLDIAMRFVDIWWYKYNV
jgi:hypothetical protein